MWTLSFGSSTILGPVGVVKDLAMRLVSPTDGPLSTNFLFISSFSFLKARISSSFLHLVSSFLLIISTISLSRDVKSAICSASDIFSFTMLLVDTICFLLHANSLGPTVGTNCYRTGLEPREQFEHSLLNA